MFANIYEQRKAVKTELNNEIETVKALIAKLYPEGSYTDYLDIAAKYNELELFWTLTKMKLTRINFCFRTTIKALRKDASFIHANYLADELEKVDVKDIHGFTRRVDELSNELGEKKNQYTRFPEISKCLQNITTLRHDETMLKIQANSSYGNATHVFSK